MNGVEQTPQLALSIKQPWAQLILDGRKSIEVRSWTTPFRGRIWLHTGQKANEDAQLLYPSAEPLFLGGFVGSVGVASIEEFTRESWSRYREQHLVPGAMPANHYAWKLERPEALRRPVPAPGQLGLFEVPPSMVETLRSLV